MHYLLKGILLAGALTLCGLARAEVLEPGPINYSFPTTRLQGETYIFKFAQAPSGQIIAGGERILYLQDNQWHAVDMRHTRGCRGLLVDGDTLWVASLGEVGRISLPLTARSVYQPILNPRLAEAGEIWGLYKSGDDIVAITKEDIWVIDAQTGRMRQTSIPSKNRLMAVAWDGQLRISQLGGTIWALKNGEVSWVENPLPNPTEGGWFWNNSDFILTASTLYRKNTDSFTPLIDVKPINAKESIAAGLAWERWIATPTINGGLFLLDPEAQKISQVTRGSGLASLMIFTAFVDRDGRLWTGHKDGITVFESPRYGRKAVLKEEAIEIVKKDGLWISYEDHAEYQREDGSNETYPRTYKFITTPQGPMFGYFGALSINDQTIPVSGGRISKNIQLPDGRFLVVSGETLYLVNPKTAQAEKVSAPPPTEIVGFDIVRDLLWAVTNDGNLYQSPPTAPFSFTKAAAIPNGAAAELAHVNSTLVFVTKERVMFGPEFKTVEFTDGLRNPAFATTVDGTVWLGGMQQGRVRLGRLRPVGNSLRWETVDAKGLNQLSELRSLSADQNTLTLCSGRMMLELNTEYLKPTYRLAPPTLQFTYEDSATVAEITSAQLPATLAADKSSLTFNGTLPFDELGERPAFERRLLPTETEWLPTKAGEKVAYPSLSSRSYQLEVRATHLGRIGPVVSHAFIVLPPWYLSSLALVSYLVIAVVFSMAVYRLRTRQIRARNLELERVVGERTRELAEASAAKTEFLASMSHEIRNPMNGVIGLVNILREQPGLPRQANTLRLLHGCAEQLRSTVDDILDFSKIEARRVGLEESTFDLLDTLEAAAATVDPAGGSITFAQRPPAGVSLRGDAAKLRQIFANYLNNALKYGVPPGAKVSTILTPADDRVRLTLSVTSTGPTIEKDALDKLFESFTRGEDAIERNIRGTGLGLAICKRYAEAMGGEVGAVSTNGETTFYLNVPFEKVEVSVVSPIESVTVMPSSHTLPARALAIEDEDYNRIVLGDILAKMNYSVDWATTGAEALQLAQENGYDIILTDYRLPDTNGVELTKKILQLCTDPKPAVFAVTAYSTRERRDECLAAGMSGFISKPITLEKLRTTIYSWGDRQLTKISLEASIRPVRPTRRSAEIETGWTELKRIATTNTKQAAEEAHRLNNLCRSLHQIDIAEQLELLEGALERHEPTGQLVSAIERLLRA